MARYAFTAGLLGLLPALAHAMHGLPVPISKLRQQSKWTKVGVTAAAIHDAAAPADATYPTYTLSVPVDHFHNDSLYEPHSDEFFDLRYWFDAQWYEEGGPVIVLAGGETSGEDRFPFLQKGILYQLAKATKGVGVILEHRYYGESWPVADTSTENMRFLTTDQALADTAYFAQHVVFPGLEDVDLSSNSTAYIAYGGSYAGAFVAFLRKLYPDVYWGAISSSGVTQAIWDYWQYFEAAMTFGPAACIETAKKLTHVVDNILIGQKGTEWPDKLKRAFGYSTKLSDADFASSIVGGIYDLQSYNWDPAVGATDFFSYCDALANDTVVHPETEAKRDDAQDLLKIGGYGDQLDTLTNHLLNYIGEVGSTVLSDCVGDTYACFNTENKTFYAQDSSLDTWRSWPYQYCTQWGFLQTGSGVPAGELGVVSRTVDVEYSATVCRDAFNLTGVADVGAINKHGGFGISYPRLAIVDGEWDPWRAATPHALGQPERQSTLSEPFLIIDKGVHHWDENGLFANETTPDLPPKSVAAAQDALRAAVVSWVEEYQSRKNGTGTGSGSSKARFARHRPSSRWL
ncbi:hypothetical protein SLS62_000013 [Diatrype stigma]|uniref:Uncharacterized protein n=1 Tax=Diatrype stigma TaxID=117547 RepID=A0AAN9YWW7_9PEZI